MKKYKKGSRSVGLVMPFLSLMALKPLMVEKHNPLESTVHISHIAQHAVAGERHAFSLEEDRSQKTEYWHAETAETAETPSFRAQRSGVEKSFHTEASRREKNPTQITRIFTDFSVRRQIMLASERISQSREAATDYNDG